LLHATMNGLPSNRLLISGGRRWPVISVGIAAALVAVLIGSQMPSALHRSERASEVARLKAELLSTQRGSHAVVGLVGLARLRLEDGNAENDDLASQIDRQEEEIAVLRETVAALKRDIAAVGG
jgi:hypothetical protein